MLNVLLVDTLSLINDFDIKLLFLCIIPSLYDNISTVAKLQSVFDQIDKYLFQSNLVTNKTLWHAACLLEDEFRAAYGKTLLKDVQ